MSVQLQYAAPARGLQRRHMGLGMVGVKGETWGVGPHASTVAVQRRPAQHGLGKGPGRGAHEVWHNRRRESGYRKAAMHQESSKPTSMYSQT